ncbi:hypothetical protein [Caenispirillum salinarum]
MAEPRGTEEDRKKVPKPVTWDDFFDGPACRDFPDRKQPPAEKREPF